MKLSVELDHNINLNSVWNKVYKLSQEHDAGAKLRMWQGNLA
jgi:hypothetical protein